MKRLRVLPLLAALAALLASPLAAQLGYTGPEGLFIRLHELGGGWGVEQSTGWDRLKAGQVGGGREIDMLSVRHAKVPLRIQVRAGGRWLPEAKPGEAAGAEGKPVTGIRLRADGRAIRYRASFAGRVTEWFSDGEDCTSGNAALDAIDVELLDGAPRGAPVFEYRVLFSGGGFTPWLKAGQTAEAKGPGAAATAIEVRSGGGLKVDVRLEGSAWSPTVQEGEVAGDPTGARAITSLRVIPAGIPIRYRLRTRADGWGFWQNGGEEAHVASGARVDAIQLELKPSSK